MLPLSCNRLRQRRTAAAACGSRRRALDRRAHQTSQAEYTFGNPRAEQTEKSNLNVAEWFSLFLYSRIISCIRDK